VQLIYFKGDRPNFGDDMNAVLWPRLAPQLFETAGPEGFLGIGTIIGMKTNAVDTMHVFSSGLGYNAVSSETAARRRVWCVRGPLTAALLGEGPESALTDGAVLAPAVWEPPAHRSGTAVVPHWETMLAGGWSDACRQAGMTLVDPMLSPEEVIPKIAAASLVLTESLHGAIIADTYGVPWIAFATSGNFSVFKWMDWTQSVGVDLKVHVLRPPTAVGPIRFGRPAHAEWGGVHHATEADALTEFKLRTSGGMPHAPSAASLKQKLKQMIGDSPLLQQVLGYHSARTAEALSRLSVAETTLSDPQVRQDLRNRMRERLADLVATQALAAR
jgi:succinoglycan biosynthesis protein ExoV